MKRLKVCENFLSQEKTDELLDKISKYGIKSLTLNEKEFLDAVSFGDYDDVQNKIKILNSDTFFENEFFRFELDDIIYEEDEIEYIGNLYVPDLEKSNRIIEGNISGRIILYNNGSYSLDFIKVSYEKGKEIEYDVFDFCSGLEYELDNFIDYIIQELE